VLFNSTIPVWIMLLGWLAWREPLSRRQALGVFISLIGVAAIVAHGDLLSLGSFRFNQGDAWLLLAMMLWAVYTLLLRWKPKELSSPAFLASIILFGMPPLAIAYAWEVASGARWELTVGAAASLLYYGIFPSVLAFMFFNRGVASLGANRAGIFVHLVPVFGFLLSALLLSEPPHAYHLYGMALVLLGVWLCSAGAVRPQAVAGSEL
ncbi:MAG: DMT family transporter, partial [Betaproteobacteria bacterium]